MASTSAIVAGEAKYKGVRKRKWGKYVSEIRLPNSRDRIWLGSYDTAEKAARAFDAALFCLRGRCATFNFPDHPPDIPGGQSLSPAEIQVVAQRYGNGYAPPPPPQEEVEEEDGGARAGPVDLVDCSFWDMVDGNGGGGGDSDFGLFDQGPGDDVFVSPHFETWNHEEEEDGYYYEHGNMDSSLWNF